MTVKVHIPAALTFGSVFDNEDSVRPPAGNCNFNVRTKWNILRGRNGPTLHRYCAGGREPWRCWAAADGASTVRG